MKKICQKVLVMLLMLMIGTSVAHAYMIDHKKAQANKVKKLSEAIKLIDMGEQVAVGSKGPLAAYDKNKNGILDRGEIPAIREYLDSTPLNNEG